MLAAIDFNYEVRFFAKEIQDVRTEGMLPTELVAVRVAVAQVVPEAGFGFG
jgi:hypothetical protein